jgi:hypothetical protein
MNKNDFITFAQTGAQPFTKPGNYQPVPNCNGFFVVNTGDAIATVNGHILYPGTPGTINGDSVTFGGNIGEILTGSISVFFGAGANPKIVIDQKFYNNIK